MLDYGLASGASMGRHLIFGKSGLFGELSLEGAQKGDQVSDLSILELLPELHLRHDAHDFAQVGLRPVVKVGRRLGDVAQRRHLEHVLVRFVLGDVVAAEVRVGELSASHGEVVFTKPIF